MTAPKLLRRVALGATAALGFATVVAAVPAQASGGASVSAKPSVVTPYLTSGNSTVTQLASCGGRIYAVGHFSKIKSPVTGKTYTRHNIFRFNARTGRVSAWHPRTNHTIMSIALSADCNKIYIGGTFSRVNGHTKQYLAKISGKSGDTYTHFRPNPDKTVFTVVRLHKRILVGGSFTSIGGKKRTAMASVHRRTGEASSYLNLKVSGTLSTQSGPTKMYKFELSPSAHAMLAMGNYTSVDNHSRRQMVMLKLHTTHAVVGRWYAPDLAKPCSPIEAFYVRAAAWSPDEKQIYIATTGDKGTSPFCDVAAAFTSTPRSTHKARWINSTGCDSLYSIAADSSTVYFGGHEQYQDNAGFCDTKGPNASVRGGIGAVTPTHGTTLPWNPSRSPGHGADDMLRTSAGLWVASDNFFNSDKCGKLPHHAGICFFPNG